MTEYIIRRVAYLLPVSLGLSLLAYALTDMAPGDPARIILQQQTAQRPTAAEVAAFRRDLGYDDPFVIRYGRWLVDAARGDLGTSLRTGEPVLAELSWGLLRTLELAVPAFVLGLVVAVPLGIAAAVWRNKATDHTSRMLALLGASMPSFWLAYLLILLFAVRLGLLPVTGRGSWRHAVLPTLTLALGASAALTRLMRASLLEVLGEPFVRSAEGRGLPPRVTVLRHALRNAVIPVMTLAGTRFGYLLGGAVIVETVFAWPGLGKHVVDSIHARDVPTIQGFVLFIGMVFVVVNLVVDVMYVWIDPRVRLAPRN